jgi:catechol 2,3-dioxygenase-like lactoylglutathione lyase family enzyme
MSYTSLNGICTFRMNNYAEAIPFYIGFLGFHLDWEHSASEDGPIYMQISKNGLMLHLSDSDRFREGSVVFVETKGLDDLHQEFTERKGHFDLPAIEHTPWGTRQLEITDPSGNMLRFNQNG